MKSGLKPASAVQQADGWTILNNSTRTRDTIARRELIYKGVSLRSDPERQKNHGVEKTRGKGKMIFDPAKMRGKVGLDGDSRNHIDQSVSSREMQETGMTSGDRSLSSQHLVRCTTGDDESSCDNPRRSMKKECNAQGPAAVDDVMRRGRH